MIRIRQGITKAKRRTKLPQNKGAQEQAALAPRGRPLSRYLRKNKDYTVIVPVLPEKTKPERPSSVDMSPGSFFTEGMGGGW